MESWTGRTGVDGADWGGRGGLGRTGRTGADEVDWSGRGGLGQTRRMGRRGEYCVELGGA